MAELTAAVAIIGAGPVGLSLALDLAWRGVDVVVLELRRAAEPPSVRCNHVSARTMEAFRRLGFGDRVRAAGLPDDYPNDASFRITFVGEELSRIPIPSRADRFTAKDGPDGWWPTPEPPHRINQTYLEPIMFGAAAAHPRITILNRTEATGIEQGSEGVKVTARSLDDGAVTTVAARYLVGCDGARSPTRKAIGAKFHGDAVLQRVQSSHIRAPGLLQMAKAEPAWFTYAFNLRRPGTVIAIDGRDEWLVHCYLKPDEPDFASVDRDRQIRNILGVGEDFEYELLNQEDWFGRRLVADRFRSGRIFICGDAAHIWAPYAGYGMNAGIADAMNLSWMLAAHLNGWAPETILEAHEAERLPITEQVSRFAMETAMQVNRTRRALPEHLEDDTEEGRAARAELGRQSYETNVQQLCCGGLNFGYFYEGSPIIAYDGQTAPPYTMYDFTPSTVPGCRLPHFWLPDGRSLYDALGPEFTLLAVGEAADPGPILEAAVARGVPMTLLRLAEAPAEYRHRLTLARPDQHVAWRGDDAPADPLTLVDRVRGAAPGAAVPPIRPTTEPAVDDAVVEV